MARALSLRLVTTRSPAPMRAPSMPMATTSLSTSPATTRNAWVAWFSSVASALVATVTASAPSRPAARAASAAMAATASPRLRWTTTAPRSKSASAVPTGSVPSRNASHSSAQPVSGTVTGRPSGPASSRKKRCTWLRVTSPPGAHRAAVSITPPRPTAPSWRGSPTRRKLAPDSRTTSMRATAWSTPRSPASSTTTTEPAESASLSPGPW